MASSDPSKKPRPGPWPPAPDSAAMPPSSWAKRTGFRPKFSGETNASDSGQITTLPLPPAQPPVQEQAQAKPKQPDSNLDLEAGPVAPRQGPTSNGEAVVARDRAKEKDKELTPPVRKRRESDGGKNLGANGLPTAGEGSRRARNDGAATVDVLPQSLDDDGFISRNSHMKYELRDSPGLDSVVALLKVKIMSPLITFYRLCNDGGTEDTANVVSTVLFTSGMTTLLHISFGSRLPLIQGPSFVYLAPVLAIINSPEFLGLNGNNFKHIMKELQGAIIIGSAFQAFLGYSGLMKILLRYEFISSYNYTIFYILTRMPPFICSLGISSSPVSNLISNFA
ncbi:PREDICTED: nucleobase-ascorbate transporter 12 [Erythranthe guttata]|uniref:nucleobase-ascorbate transporter 12 n=1 Tax=Erythranthe guttata TaxID=4155 RepID=UPI00064DA175|nr:PREDICTED: nucleobase-ascorbate transporter 12 [Erythranthe guttata]|eukprot:XP_012852872.1 PREDICTED: nucleobase-ascorbate transporter 12 [Erythranthe guttata]